MFAFSIIAEGTCCFTHWGLVTPYGDMNLGRHLAQVMACCLTAPSHCLNQCCLHINELLRYLYQVHKALFSLWVWKLCFENYCPISQRPMSQILPNGTQGSVYPTYSMPWLLMSSKHKVWSLDFIPENVFENAVCKMAVILFQTNSVLSCYSLLFSNFYLSFCYLVKG